MQESRLEAVSREILPSQCPRKACAITALYSLHTTLRLYRTKPNRQSTTPSKMQQMASVLKRELSKVSNMYCPVISVYR